MSKLDYVWSLVCIRLGKLLPLTSFIISNKGHGSSRVTGQSLVNDCPAPVHHTKPNQLSQVELAIAKNPSGVNSRPHSQSHLWAEHRDMWSRNEQACCLLLRNVTYFFPRSFQWVTQRLKPVREISNQDLSLPCRSCPLIQTNVLLKTIFSLHFGLSFTSKMHFMLLKTDPLWNSLCVEDFQKCFLTMFAY